MPALCLSWLIGSAVVPPVRQYHIRCAGKEEADKWHAGKAQIQPLIKGAALPCELARTR